jgi:hypothetical protein
LKIVLDGPERYLFESLSRPGSGYRRAATFQPVHVLGQQSTFPFVNPRVWVFARE